MISRSDQNALREHFRSELRSRVRIDLFTQKPSPIIIPGRQECRFCEDVQTLLTEVASLSERLSLTVHDFYANAQEAAAFEIDAIPATVFRGANNRPMRYFGMPTGAMFPAFIETLIETSNGSNQLQPATLRQLKKVRDEVRLQVLLTPSCEHSPVVAHTAYRLARQNAKVRADVIEVSEFPDLLQRFAIQATPAVVIDTGRSQPLVLFGGMDEATLVDFLLRAVEGKSMTEPPALGPLTPLVATQPQEVRMAGSGLIIPR